MINENAFFPDRTWVNIDVDALTHNVENVRRWTVPSAKLMAVVKADAYGHGAPFCASWFLEHGADCLGVSNVDEARQLREAGIAAPILILGYTDPRNAPYIVGADLTATVYSVAAAQALHEEAVRQEKKVKVHIKLDTGMGRIGYTEDSDYLEQIPQILRMSGLEAEGIFSHFATSDEENGYADMQYEKFMEMLECLRQSGIEFPVRHMSNSGAVLRDPKYHLDMVRAGIVLYGLVPGALPAGLPEDFCRPAMTLKSTLVMTKHVEAGDSVGYGRAFTAQRSSLIGTIPIGYADGYSRRLSNRAWVMVGGRRSPVVGNICMDQCMIDLTDLRDAPSVGEQVVLFGRQNTQQRQAGEPCFGEIATGELAEWMGTIHYEVTCVVGKRVTRIYEKDGKMIHMFNTIW